MIFYNYNNNDLNNTFFIIYNMLDNIYYINLDKRTDRKTHVENELKKMNWNNYTRFNAIKMKDGRVGCSMSHLKLLQMAKEKNLDYIVIIEDDIQFTQPEIYNKMLSLFLNMNLEYDVLLLAGNIRPPFKPIKDHIFQVYKSFTTTGYLVKKHYYDTLINNIKEGITNLIKYPKYHGKFAIDTNWFSLQQKDTWLIFMPRTVTQLPDYSDIEGKEINYNHVMLDNISKTS